jgi:hypothetical protein
MMQRQNRNSIVESGTMTSSLFINRKRLRRASCSVSLPAIFIDSLFHILLYYITSDELRKEILQKKKKKIPP